MRAMTISAFGGPEVLKIAEMPEPSVGPGDVLIEVHAAGLNPVDTKIRRGMHGPKTFPLIPGYDVSGVIRAIGSQVNKDLFKVGDEVYASPSLGRQGAHAELVAVDHRTVALKPRSIDHVQAAALPLVTLTAWESLNERARIHAGETVLVHAGAGGVGHIGVQLAKIAGCTVWTTASRPETIKLCKQLGADLVINHKEEDFAERVKKETGDKGLPVIFDTVGDPVFDKSLDIVAVCGRLVTIVYNENPRIVPALFRKNATLHMEFMGAPTIHNINPQNQGEILRTAAELVDAGKLKVHVHKVVKLEELPAAHAEQQAGGVIGKIVVKMR
jgi:NADPH2:quinone reductase